MQKERKVLRLPKGFTRGMKEVGGNFLWGIWDGMSPGREINKDKRKRKSRS